MSTRLRVATSGKYCSAEDIASGAAIGRFVRCVAGLPGEPLTVAFADGNTASLQVSTIADLVALSGVGFGQQVRVSSVGRSFVFTASGVSPLIGLLVLSGTGGDWHSVQGTSDTRWQYQTTWFIDGVAGNDESSGLTAATAIRSMGEFAFRLGNAAAQLRANLVLTVLSDPPDATNLTLYREDIDSSLTIQSGGGVPVANGTLGSYAVASSAANEATLVTVVGIADFTPFVGLRLSFGAQGISTIVAANPAGLGVQFARITAPKIDSPQGFTGAPVIAGVPVLGQPVSVLRKGPDLAQVTIEVSGALSLAGDFTTRPFVYLNGVRASVSCSLTSTSNEFGAPAFHVFGCDLRDPAIQEGAVDLCACSLHFFSYLYIGSTCYACAFYSEGLDLQQLLLRKATGYFTLIECVSQSVAFAVYDPSVLVDRFAIFDVPAFLDAVVIHSFAGLYVSNWLIGKGNARKGVVLTGTSQCILSGAVLALTGTTGQIGLPTGNITAADLPRLLDRGTAEVTLVGGTRNATVPALPADARVQLTRRVAAGGIGASLTYAIAGNVITVTSSDPTETSTVEILWSSPSQRPGVIMT